MGPNRTYDEVMSRLLLVRHGRTVLNEQRRTQGASDSPLTDEGRAGARVTARYLADLPLHRAYLSPMGRVTETADLLLADRPQVGRTVLEGLREYHYGIYDGGPDEQMRQALDPFTHVPAVLAGTHPGAPGGRRRRGPARRPGPGGLTRHDHHDPGRSVAGATGAEHGPHGELLGDDRRGGPGPAPGAASHRVGR